MTPAEARVGLRIRAEAMIRGRCACGASLEERALLAHKADCPAISEVVVAAAEQDLVSWATVLVRLPSHGRLGMAAVPAATRAGDHGMGGAA